MVLKGRPFIAFIFIFAVLANIVTLKNGHNWGDDFSQYIIHANNIIEGKPYASGIMLDAPVVCPPGFPFLLLPVLKILGLNFKALKLLNILSWYLAILFLYSILLKSCSRGWALAASLLVSLSSYFFIYKQNVLSDIPFFFFVCCSLYLFERHQNGKQKKSFLLFLLSISAALWVRPAGNIIFIAAGFYLLLIARDIKLAGWLFLTYVLNEILLFFWVGYHPGFFLTIAKVPQTFFLSVLYNLPTVFKSLLYFFCPPQNAVSSIFFNTPQVALDILAPYLYLFMLWLFIRRIQNRSLSFIYYFSFIYISLVILWSGFTISVDWFIRFIFPLIPMVFIESYQLLQWIGGRSFVRIVYKTIFCILLLINVTNIITGWNFNDDAINQLPNQQLIAWVKHNIKPNEHYMFWKARCMALLTGRVGTVYRLGFIQQPAFEKRVQSLHISYVILSKGIDARFIAYLQHQPRQWQCAWENNSYKIFKITKLAGI